VTVLPRTQRPAVERAVSGDDVVAELRPDPAEKRRAGGDHIAGDRVRIDDRDSERSEQVRDGTLAARDTAGETDAIGTHAARAGD